MLELDITILFAGVIAGAAPIVLAALGETITEKAGLINLSLDGSILLSAMAARLARDSQACSSLSNASRRMSRWAMRRRTSKVAR